MCWKEVGERKVLGTKMIQQRKEAIKIIWKRLLIAQIRQWKYADMKRKDMEFKLMEAVLL